MKITRLDPFGVKISDIDLRDSRSSKESARLLGLLNSHYLVIFRDQNLNDDDHLQLFHDMFPGADLGDETGTGTKVSYVSNVRADGLFGDAPLTFHSDFSFTIDPTRLISLYGSEVEPGSAPTEFVNGEMALAALPADLHAYLADKSVVNATDLMSVEGRLPSYNLLDRQDLSGRPHDEILRAAWPVIMEHPRTGRPLIYVNEQHSHHLHNVPLAEGREILAQLCSYLYQPENIFTHFWKQGDLVLWDNIALAHGRRATAPSAARRTLRRVRSGGASLPTMVSLSQRGLEGPDPTEADQMFASPDVQAQRRKLGNRIRSIRLAQGLTQRDLANVTAIEFQMLTRCELGNRLPSSREISAIAAALKVDIEVLEGDQPL